MSYPIRALALSFCLLATNAFAVPGFVELKQADKAAIALTGKPLTDDMRNQFLKGEISLETIVDQLSKSPGFIDRFAGYWTKTLGIQSPFNSNQLRSASTGKSIYSVLEGVTWLGIGFENAAASDAKWLQGVYDYRATAPLELWIDYCDDAPMITWRRSIDFFPRFKKAAEDGIGWNGDPILPGTQAGWKKLQDLAGETFARCGDKTIPVKPWWDPDQVTVNGKYKNVLEYRTLPAIITHCGPKLERCSTVSESETNIFMNKINRDISLEPGYLIAQTVAEDRPFSEVLTTPQTVMTGTQGYFMSTWGKDLWANFPGKGFADANHKIFSSPNISDRSRYWITRNTLNAGILTTPGYQLATNGRRAMINRAYETFLCRKFVVPEGAQADPTDSNPDLTKRAYCSYCHKSIEPMAAFFNRWPTTGVNNFVYDNDGKNVSDAGRFNGSAGQGAAAFGKILSESDYFDDCSVQRAFEFVNGRKMTYSESVNMTPAAVAAFGATEKNLRKVIKAMILSPEFLNPKGLK
ncbi:MAG: DUF1585 domain-containing protein [Bdellovibrionota bacterium]